MKSGWWIFSKVFFSPGIFSLMVLFKFLLHQVHAIAVAEENVDTDKIMGTMFEILRGKRTVKLESLLLNRKSFAQTVENLFALSYLVKDGRVVIHMDANGFHLVCKIQFREYCVVSSLISL